MLKTHNSRVARMYQCIRCYCQTFICPCCDRGNVYCQECARKGRQEARKRASKRYQNTTQGRLNHAARQQRYRLRQKEKVTHKGCAKKKTPVLISLAAKRSERVTNHPTSVAPGLIVCHFCRTICSLFLRENFLHRSVRITI